MYMPGCKSDRSMDSHLCWPSCVINIRPSMPKTRTVLIGEVAVNLILSCVGFGKTVIRLFLALDLDTAAFPMLKNLKRGLLSFRVSSNSAVNIPFPSFGPNATIGG